jgi:hypothetical protein
VPGIYCHLEAGHPGNHEAPRHVERGKEHRHPFAEGEYCLRCDRCGNNMYYPVKGHCEYCARRAEIGMSLPPKRTHCACGSAFIDTVSS